MLKAINEGILVDGDVEKELLDLEKKLEDKVFFKEGTDFLLFSENKMFYSRLKELLDKYNHNLYMLKKQESLIQNNVNKTQIIQKRLRSGQKIECEGDLILLGDLAPGAEIEAKGNIFILGNAQGLVHAGIGGDKKAVIVALEMNVNFLKIADEIAKSPEDSSSLYPEIAYLNEEGKFIVEEIKNSESYTKYLSQKLPEKEKKGFRKLFRF